MVAAGIDWFLGWIVVNLYARAIWFGVVVGGLFGLEMLEWQWVIRVIFRQSRFGRGTSMVIEG